MHGSSAASYHRTVLDLDRLQPETLRRITRAEYDQMVAMGLFEGERIELLHGLLVHMSPIGTRHDEAVMRLTELLVLALAGRARVGPQCAFAASDDSEPQPDLAVLPLGDYSQEHPARAHLLIEVADSSLSKDRHIKADLYAAAGVPEYWIVNLVDDAVEVLSRPKDGAYTQRAPRGRGETLVIAAVPDVSLAVDRLLP